VVFFTLILARSTVWMTPSMSNAIRRRTQDYPQKEIQNNRRKTQLIMEMQQFYYDNKIVKTPPTTFFVTVAEPG
jgi:hypothetical protein